MNAHKYRIILQREFYSKKHLCVSFVLYCLIDPQSYCDKKMNTLIYEIYMEGINMFVDESYLEKLIIDDNYFDLVLYNHEMELTRQFIGNQGLILLMKKYVTDLQNPSYLMQK